MYPYYSGSANGLLGFHQQRKPVAVSSYCYSQPMYTTSTPKVSPTADPRMMRTRAYSSQSPKRMSPGVQIPIITHSRSLSQPIRTVSQFVAVREKTVFEQRDLGHWKRIDSPISLKSVHADVDDLPPQRLALQSEDSESSSGGRNVQINQKQRVKKKKKSKRDTIDPTSPTTTWKSKGGTPSSEKKRQKEDDERQAAAKKVASPAKRKVVTSVPVTVMSVKPTLNHQTPSFTTTTPRLPQPVQVLSSAKNTSESSPSAVDRKYLQRPIEFERVDRVAPDHTPVVFYSERPRAFDPPGQCMVLLPEETKREEPVPSPLPEKQRFTPDVPVRLPTQRLPAETPPLFLQEPVAIEISEYKQSFAHTSANILTPRPAPPLPIIAPSPVPTVEARLTFMELEAQKGLPLDEARTEAIAQEVMPDDVKESIRTPRKHHTVNPKPDYSPVRNANWELKVELQVKESQIQFLKDQLDELTTNYEIKTDTLQQDIDAKEKHIQQLEEQRGKYAQLFEQIRAKSASDTEQVQMLNHTIEKQNSAIEFMKTALKHKDQSVDQLKETLKKLRQDTAEKAARVDADWAARLAREAAPSHGGGGRVGELESLIKALLEEKQMLTGKIERYEDTIYKQTEANRELNDQVEQVRQDISNLRATFMHRFQTRGNGSTHEASSNTEEVFCTMNLWNVPSAKLEFMYSSRGTLLEYLSSIKGPLTRCRQLLVSLAHSFTHSHNFSRKQAFFVEDDRGSASNVDDLFDYLQLRPCQVAISLLTEGLADCGNCMDWIFNNLLLNEEKELFNCEIPYEDTSDRSDSGADESQDTRWSSAAPGGGSVVDL